MPEDERRAGGVHGDGQANATTRCRQFGEVVGVRLEEEDIEALKNRILVIFGSAAAVIVLLGLASAPDVEAGRGRAQRGVSGRASACRDDGSR